MKCKVMNLCKFFLATVMLSGPTLSEAARLDGVVRNMLAESGTYGGCAFTLSTDTNYADTLDPANQDAACGKNWISADCEGNRLSKSQAAINWNMVQLASVTGRSVRAFFNAPTVDGKCVLQRLDILQ